MADRLPSIKLTDPQSRDAAPSLPQSPIVNGWDGEFRRPTTPASRNGISSRDGTSGASQTADPAAKPHQTLPYPSASRSDGSAQESGDDIPKQEQPSAIDPLSRHIIDRTHSSHLSPSALRASSPGNDFTVERSPSNDMGLPTPPGRTDTGTKLAKGKEKGVSFLSRIIGSKKKDQPDTISDNASEISDYRPEGAHAQVFAQPVDNIEYNPSQPQPPAYIKVRARNRKQRDFDKLFLAQELRAGPPSSESMPPSTPVTSRRRSSAVLAPGAGLNTIWAMEFSKDGKYLATAGHDKVVRVWAVIADAETRFQEERRDATPPYGSDHQRIKLSAQVFQNKPIREFKGHESTVLDLSWSKNNFLLSSSMDKTVRLWHISRPECLCTFKHNDFVPSIAFHPKDDRFFLAGSLDCKLRLWSIPDKHVAYSCTAPDMITAVAFTPDGKHAMAGCLSGMCTFYETEGLKYQTQIHVRSAHGKNAKGSKITGIQATQHPPHSSSGEVKLLISSNDSRVRLYNFRDKGMEIKFKGCVNSSSQIRASITDDHKYVCCGSEDNRAYIWPVQADPNEKRDKRPVEMFQAHDTVVTCVAFAPTKTRQLLGKSEDPIYDVCNPPPVTLMSRAERAESQSSSRPPSVHTQGLPQPRQSSDRESSIRRPSESASQIARSSHKGGNIIVTADFTGLIKVFRQDCAHNKRRPQDNWDAGSGPFMKRVGSINLNRNSSMKTKSSSRSLRSGRDSISTQGGAGDRILSWRQGIRSTPSVRNGSISSKNGSGSGNRSISPRKSSGQLSARSRDARGSPALGNNDSFASSKVTLPHATPSQEQSTSEPTVQPTGEAALRSTDDNPLMMVGEQSNLFWDLDERRRMVEETKRVWAAQQEQGKGGGSSKDVPGLQREASYVSRLSMDDSSGPASEYEDANG
ncbi:hypothetical protein MBLNU457_5893t1 [Dothideomycetes sp. NU457]